MIADKLKSLRRQAKMSQEQLAEKLNVSRQAVTKWETGIGVPDIENLKALSVLFHISIDEFLDNETEKEAAQDFLFDSVTEYDIDCLKSFDISLTSAKRVRMEGYKGEKIQVRLASDVIPDIQSAFKIKIDDQKKNIDIDVKRHGTTTVARAKESLYVFIRFPVQYVKEIEFSGNIHTLEFRGIKADNIEFTGKASRVEVDGFSGRMELNCNQDMDIICHSLGGRLDVNQISAASKVRLPAGLPFVAVVRGRANTILYESDGKPTDDFSRKGDSAENCENVIELNGMNSEMIICETVQLPEEVL